MFIAIHAIVRLKSWERRDPREDIPLMPDPYTDVSIANVNQREFANFRGTLDASGRFYLASQAVPLRSR